MLPAESFECTIPSGTAIKQAVLYCTGRPPASADTWAAITAWGTITLAVLALAAGLISYRLYRAAVVANEHQRQSLKGQRDQFKEQLEEGRRVTLLMRAEPAFTRYLDALNAHFASFRRREGGVDLADRAAELNAATAAWAAMAALRDPRMSDIVLGFTNRLRVAGSVLSDVESFAPDYALLEKAISSFQTVYNNWIGNLGRWNAEESDETVSNLAATAGAMGALFPQTGEFTARFDPTITVTLGGGQ